MKFDNNPQLQLAYNFIQYTNKNIFLTGKAGTGKTTFLLNLKGVLNKRMVVVAPTGVAAINAGGVTIHSFFQLSFGPHLPVESVPNYPSQNQNTFNSIFANRFSREKINIIKSLDLLVIDEISMVRADVLDGIDEVLRRFKDRYKPFGGVQLLMIGDLQQLPPVVKTDEWELLKDYYTTLFFFGSKALLKTQHITIELKHIYRQNDDAFIQILNKIRDNNIDSITLDELNKRYIPDFALDADDGYITLTTHNIQAQRINDSKLEKLPAKPHHFEAIVSGDFPEFNFPTDGKLFLKVGAQVMFVKNDISHEKLFYNGKIGTIVEFGEESIMVKCPNDTFPISVEPLEWSNNKYSLDEETKEIKETVIGTFTQYPLKLAWAITIHKSQGLTFEKVIIDANAAFAHGQVYVALSRCKTLDGVILNTPISSKCIKTDTTISAFTHEAEQNQPDETTLEVSKYAYQHMLLSELFDFRPIDRRLNYLLKILSEHKASLHDSFRHTFYSMSDLLKSDLLDVSAKFGNQIKQLIAQQTNIEENNALQERSKKGCIYFLEKTNAIIYAVLQNTSLETDNKAIRKSVNEALEKLILETNIKLSCLKACQDGFSITTFLVARAKASIEKPEPKNYQKVSEERISDAIPNPKLYILLKKWRNNKAEEANLPEYMVLPQKTLTALATRLPDSRSELIRVKGFGKKKTEQFGDEVMAIIRTYLEDNQIEREEDPPVSEVKPKPDAKPKSEAKIKPEKIDTKKVTLDLFKSGKTIDEIAAERGLVISTIETHLSHYVGTGELEIHQLVSQEKINLITEYYRNNPDTALTPAKIALGDHISYGELRLVLQHIGYQKQFVD